MVFVTRPKDPDFPGDLTDFQENMQLTVDFLIVIVFITTYSVVEVFSRRGKSR